MKRVLIHSILTAFCIFGCISCSKKQVDILANIPDGFPKMYITGNVKQIISSSEYMIDTIALDTKGRVIQKGHRHYSYNNDGLLDNMRAGAHIKDEYIYDNNLLIGIKHYRNDKLKDVHKLYYNNCNQLVSKKWFMDEELQLEIQYEYNSNGNIICESEFNYYIANTMHNRLGYKVAPSKTKTLYSYDEKGNITTTEWYNNSELSNTTKFKYDDKNNVIYEEEIDYDDMNKNISTYSYKYDRKGNWIEKEKISNGETLITKREITYY